MNVRQAGEPSVEEILESIKKVIARDNRAEADQVRRRREQDGIVVARTFDPADLPAELSPAFNDDEAPSTVLELTDAEMAPVASEERSTGPETGDDDEFAGDDADDSGDDAVEAPSGADEPLLAETARASVRESLTALAMLAEPGARPQIVRSGETSLEALTRDLLRPMLAEWLEKNLPPLVDKLVAAEIARIVGKRD